MNRMPTLTGAHRLVVPVTGADWVGSAWSALPIRWRGESRNALLQSSDVLFGPIAVAVLAKIDLGGVHSQRSVTGTRPCLRAASSTTGSHAAMALLITSSPPARSATTSTSGTSGGP